MNVKLESLVGSRWFERTILAVIVLAGVLAGLETSPRMLLSFGVVLRALDVLVLTIFVIEIGLKIAARWPKPWDYFRDAWNVFDFTIVVLCCLPMDSQFAAVFRLARGLRVLRLVTALPRLQLLVGALLKSLGAMGYVGLLLALMFYIYAVAGVHLFRGGDPARFGSLGVALLSLFQVITLDNWSDIYAAARGASPLGALVYFVSFILFGTMIMLNLFIGIVMNSMSEMHAEIEERNRSRHIAGGGGTTVEDELLLLERQIDELKAQTVRVRRRVDNQR